MRQRLPLFVLLASALTFLASLYLPWQELQVRPGSAGHGVLGLLNLFASGGGAGDGWSTGPGVAASLAALALVGVAAISLVRPSLIAEPPLAAIALALGYLTIGSLVVLHAGELSAPGKHYRYAYGAYLGVASAAVALLVILWTGKPNVVRFPTRVEVLAALPGVGLLVSFLLPWAPLGSGSFAGVWLPGINIPVAVLAAAGVMLLAASIRAGRPLYAAAAIAVLTGGAVNGVIASPAHVEYGAWLALGFALALAATVAFVRREALPALPSLTAGLAAAAGGVFVVALFLPWQEFCAPRGHSLGRGLGRCVETTGWTQGEPAAVAGTLAIVLIFAVVVARWSAALSTELTLAIAILTAAVGVGIAGSPAALGWGFDYGSYVGFAAAAIMLLAALARIRLPRLESGRVIDRLIPLAASLACVCVVALPLWSVLPERWSLQEDVLQGWYAMAGVLLTIHLLRGWLESAGGVSFDAEELMLLPLVLLALTTLELVRERNLGMTWGGGILVGLCLLLTLFGWIEQKGGLRRLEVPEILRVDRLPKAES